MGYPVWWETAVTIYNRYEDAVTHVVKWYRTEVPGTFWQYVRDKMTVGSETVETEKIVCRIRKDDRFLEKHQWVNVSNDEMGDYFTLGRGDIIVKGTSEDEINEYVSGQRSTDLIAKYKELQGCMEIETVSINTGSGRCCEHYLAEGL